MTNSVDLKFIDNPKAVFFANQVITGTVVLSLNKAVKTRGLRLIVKGKAECEWSETRGLGRYQRTVRFAGKEVYLNSERYLAGSEHGSSIKIPVGVHTYNFKCLLPESIPYSVEGTKGFIRYKVEARLDIPWGLDYKIKKPFTVVRYDDLNLVQSPNFRRPCEIERIKTFGLMCWESKPLIITMRIPKSGFGLGDKIPIHVRMINNSNNNVYSTRFNLVKTEQFNSTSPSRSSRKCQSVVTSKNSRGVGAGKTVDFIEFLQIPQVLPTSNERFSKVFQVKYHVHFKARSDGLGNPGRMEIDIAIGNVGVDETASAQEVSAESQIQLFSPTAPTLSSFFSLPTFDLPPSYEEVTRRQP